MSTADAMAERHAAQLAELAALGMTLARDLARDLAGRAGAAPDDASAERMALAFHRVSRAVRQTLALESRLARDRHVLAGQEREGVRRAVSERKAQVRAPVSRLIWTEAEGLEDEDGENDTAEGLLGALEESLEEAGLEPGFLETPVETLVARVRAELGLAANDAQPPPDWSSGDPPAAAAPRGPPPG